MSQIWGNLGALTWQMVAMWLIGGVLIYLAICKDMEPSLLLPIGFGCDPGATCRTPARSTCWIPCLKRASRTSCFPLLLFIGIGAMIDFGPLLSESEADDLRRGGAVWHLLYAVDGEPVRL